MDEKHIGRTSEVGSSNVQSVGMHKKSIEAAKALKEEDGGCDDEEANSSSESARSRQRHPPPINSSGPGDVSLEVHQRPASGRQSDDHMAVGGSTATGTEDAMRSDSIAALRAKVPSHLNKL